MAGAHQSSYGREAAGVFAAAVAAALTPGATIDEVVDAALAVAHDGTRAAIAAVAAAARGLARDADQETVWHAPAVGGPSRTTRSATTTAPRTWTPAGPAAPSRSRSCRSPSASVVHAAATSGPRCWARSTTAGTPTRSPPWRARCARALGGSGVIPADWVHEIEQASRIDLNAVADQLAVGGGRDHRGGPGGGRGRGGNG